MATQSKKLVRNTRERAKMRIRRKVNGSVERPRVTVYRSSKHIYAQIVCDVTHKTLAAASTLDKDVQSKIALLAAEKDAADKKKSNKSVLAAKAVGVVLAERGKSNKIDKVVFDRNGFIFAGRVKALADGAREGGLGF
jgi:large subunit ribosomal protein L18